MAEIEVPGSPVATTGVAPKCLFQKVLDGIETLGNKVPHPAVLFLLLIIVLMVFSQLFQERGQSSLLTQIHVLPIPFPFLGLDASRFDTCVQIPIRNRCPIHASVIVVSARNRRATRQSPPKRAIRKAPVELPGVCLQISSEPGAGTVPIVRIPGAS